jgi:hypothetical protein
VLSSGSAWTPVSPHRSALSGVTLPPSSVAAGEIAQLAGPVIGPAPPLTVVRLRPMIEPWKRTVEVLEMPPTPVPPVPARAVLRTSVTPRNVDGTEFAAAAIPAPLRAELLKIVESVTVTVAEVVAPVM